MERGDDHGERGCDAQRVERIEERSDAERRCHAQVVGQERHPFEPGGNVLSGQVSYH